METGMDIGTGMSVADVKRDLPPVKILWEGRKYWARVSGRLNEFASVSPSQPIERSKRVRTIMGPIFHYSWDTVTRAVNNGGTLRT